MVACAGKDGNLMELQWSPPPTVPPIGDRGVKTRLDIKKDISSGHKAWKVCPVPFMPAQGRKDTRWW